MTDEVRPRDYGYYETRLEFLSQGDIFRDVPLAYPSPAREIVEEMPAGTGRRFLSGPFEPGFALLLTPTCSMRSQSDPSAYAHTVRALARGDPSRVRRVGIPGILERDVEQLVSQ